MKGKLSFLSLLCLALLLTLPPQLAYSQRGVVIEICPVCKKPKQACPYKMKHPTCKTCRKLKEQCPYKGKHPTTGTLSITSTPSSAVIKIDGKYKGETPLTVENKKPGSYSITFSLEGYETETQIVFITAGKTTSCSATLTERQVQQPPTLISPTPSYSSDDTITVNDISFKMIRVEGGTFQMGSATGDSDERPVHKVTLNSFSIGETEVTQELWGAVMGTNPSNFKGSKHPVENVSWNDCQKFIAELNKLTGKEFRLPTEAEWEFAAKGGNKSRGYVYSGSNTLDEVGWYYENSVDSCLDDSIQDNDIVKQDGCCTHPVKQKKSNELGIYDMSGNVCEWCQDWYDFDYYMSRIEDNPVGPSSGSEHALRGGSWFHSAKSCRIAHRSNSNPTNTIDILGLRLAL